jgi:hypothetical protein
MKIIRDRIKIDPALTPTSLASTNLTTRYYDLKGYDSALFVLSTAVMAAAATAKIEVFGADVATGVGGALITGHTATITSPTKVTQGYIHVNSPDNDDAVVVNGVTFTKKASVDAAARQFTNIAELRAQIISHVPGVTATIDNTNYLIIDPVNPGALTITLASEAAKLVVSSRNAVAFIEALSAAGKRYVAAKVTTTATVICAVDLVRGIARKLPVAQATAAQFPAL